MRAVPFAAALLLASLAVAGPARAEPTLGGVNLGEYVAGPKVTSADLKGRVVVFEYWGVNCPPCKASIPHLAEVQNKYPYQALLVVANQCQGGGAANAAKVWKEHDGGAKVVVRDGGDLPGSNVSGIPRVFVFNAFGKMVFDGKPSDAKFDEAIAAAVKTIPNHAALQKAQAEQERTQAIFGSTKIPGEFDKIVQQLADTSKSCANAYKALETATRSKEPKYSEPAQTMLGLFNTHVAEKCAEMGKLALDGHPAEAWATMETLAKWVPHMEEGLKAQKQKAEWLRDPAFLKELGADKNWLALKAEADKIGFEKNPKAKPSGTLESFYKKMLKENPGTKGLERAKAAADGWKLDPETGRADKWKPAPKPETKTEPQPEAKADTAPAKAEEPAKDAGPKEIPDAQKSVLGN